MTREIKFRSWKNGELIEDVIEFGDDTILEPIDQYEYETESVDCIEQYTGLKDKNGWEIYEGDIVRDTMNQLYRIVEHPKWHRLIINHLHDSSIWFDFGDIDYRPSDLEVIGNIHENLELIGRTSDE